jgi:hypothetical protein
VSEAFDRTLLLFDAAHRIIHDMPDSGPETDTCLVSLSERDLVAIGLALPVMQLTYPCLGEVATEIQSRLIEIVSVQRPDWLIGREELEGSES